MAGRRNRSPAGCDWSGIRSRSVMSTIYKFAYSSDGHAIKLWRHLPEHRARLRPRPVLGDFIALKSLVL